jgi:formylmethanofuran dehydrogenase subunit D
MTTVFARTNWLTTDPKDMRGVDIRVGDRVVRGSSSGRAVSIQVVEIGRVEDGKVYVVGSKVKINFPGRLLIVNDLFPKAEVNA